jgi:hypothetical protein
MLTARHGTGERLMPAPGGNSYLEQGLAADRADLARVRALIDETAAGLVRARTGNSWPYVVEANKERQPANSASTDSMIAFALAAAAGTPLESPLAPEPAEDQLGSRTGESLEAGDDVDRRKRLTEIVRAAVERVIGEKAITSRTYGPNDPFTLSWLVPVAHALEVKWSWRETALDDRLKRAWGQRTVEGMRDLFTPGGEAKALPHAFPLLRAVHLTRSANDVCGPAVVRELPPELADEFLAIIHRQLANREVDDASFDPAELIFALEGLLRSPAGGPSEALIDQIFEDLGAHQEHSPSWRPLRPFLATGTGFALLPLSVEGASALARICREIDRWTEDTRRFSRHLELFRKYVQWLEAQRVEITLDDAKLRGWNSEHVREPKTIYTWQTSQVLLFLLLYSQLLQRHIALHTISAANLSVDYRLKRRKENPPAKSWDIVRKAFVSEPGRPHENNRSAVLFGPPGTGKTTLAKWLAAELGWPLITISPSDFMAQGTAAVEARAKAVFTALMQQRRTVILFDEIDRLILDRDHPDYGKQEGAFQLMTPSMLTKLNDLRQAGEVIFLVGTNYVERIDRAITRPGRFDKQLLISPPDDTDRKEYLEEEWRARKREIPAADPDALARLAKRLWLATYAEMRDLTVRAETVSQLGKLADKFQPATTLESYAARLGVSLDEGGKSKEPPGRAPYAEVLALRKLYPESALSPLEKRVAAAADEFRKREAEHLRRRKKHVAP